MLKSPSNFSIISMMSERERLESKRLVDYSHLQSLPELWPLVAERLGDKVALRDPHTKPETVVTYTQLAQQIQYFAAGLQALGVEVVVGEGSTDLPPRISLIADNSPRWFVADQGIMTAGAANAVRSCQAEKEELLFIIAIA
jgi:long-chain acyl-CoA synthetase